MRIKKISGGTDPKDPKKKKEQEEAKKKADAKKEAEQMKKEGDYVQLDPRTSDEQNLHRAVRNLNKSTRFKNSLTPDGKAQRHTYNKDNGNSQMGRLTNPKERHQADSVQTASLSYIESMGYTLVNGKLVKKK